MNGNAMSTMKPLGEALVDALEALLLRDEQNTCRHENTHRGGAIWEICDDCGAQWADDRGGKPEWKEPQEWVRAREVLEKARQSRVDESTGMSDKASRLTDILNEHMSESGKSSESAAPVSGSAERIKKGLELLVAEDSLPKGYVRHLPRVVASKLLRGAERGLGLMKQKPESVLGAIWDRLAQMFWLPVALILNEWARSVESVMNVVIGLMAASGAVMLVSHAFALSLDWTQRILLGLVFLAVIGVVFGRPSASTRKQYGVRTVREVAACADELQGAPDDYLDAIADVLKRKRDEIKDRSSTIR